MNPLSKTDLVKRIDFLQSRFLDYYKNNLDSIKPPPAMTEREYGFLLFREKIMIRHRAFRDFKGFHRITFVTCSFRCILFNRLLQAT